MILRSRILLSPLKKAARQAILRPHLNSIRFDDSISPDSLDEGDAYYKAFDEPLLINALSKVYSD